MTKQEAIAIAESKAWEKWTPEQRALFQINEERLCMPWDVFHAAVEQVLGRGVWTHEFASEELRREVNCAVNPDDTQTLSRLCKDSN